MARILIIDDEYNIRTLMRLALRHVGHIVEMAADGADGLAKFGDGAAWDLVLLDQRMPGMTGLDVLREIRTSAPDARVIMITAFGTIDLAVEAMRSGATDFLRKPFTGDTLRSTVATVLAASSLDLAPDTGITFGLTTINGYRIESPMPQDQHTDADMRFSYTVIGPDGARRDCTVVLAVDLVEQAKQYLGRGRVPAGARFWHAVGEEHVANYVWQNAELPADNELRIEELTTGLRRWMDSAIGAA